MSTTKSIRLTRSELDEIQPVLRLMSAGSESSGLKHLVFRGLEEVRKDLVVQMYTRRGLSTGEIADQLNMSRLEALHVLSEAHVKLLDVTAEEFQQDLARDDLSGDAPTTSA